MSRVLTNENNYYDIADTIRQMKNVNTTYKPREMASALKDIYSNEVEGTLPLSFEANGNNLLNYRIDGASGGVGDRTKNLANSNEIIQGYWAYANGDFARVNTWICTPKIPCSGDTTYTYQFSNVSRWSGFVFYDKNGNYISTSNVLNGSSTEYRTYTATSPSNARYLIVNIAGFPQTTDTISVSDLINFQLEKNSTPTDYEPYGYKVPVVVSGKNLFDEENAVNTDYYITSTGQENIGANGDKFLKSYINVNPSTQYTFKWSQTIMGYANNTPYIRISEYTSNNAFIQRLLCQCSAQSQNNYTFTTSNDTVYIDIRIDDESSTRGQHLTEIMLVKGATAPDTYEEYTATTTNIYLDEPIGENESISLSDTNVDIPTIEGTNVLTVDTTVQPSNVYIQARKDPDDVVFLTQILEEGI